MTTTDSRSTTPTLVPQVGPLLPIVTAVTAAAAISVLFLPDVTSGGAMAAHQPWNLVLFMAIPVILAETLAITELVLLFSTRPPSWVVALSRWAGIAVGPVMVAIGVYLLKNAVIPLTTSGGWRGPVDLIAVLAYGFWARVLTGPTLSPLGQLVTRVVTPLVPAAPRHVPGPPKRFAQGIGATLSTAAVVAHFAFGATTLAYALVAMITVAATLESALGFCLGCKIFGLLMRMGIVPEEACEACNDLSLRHPAAV